MHCAMNKALFSFRIIMYVRGFVLHFNHYPPIHLYSSAVQTSYQPSSSVVVFIKNPLVFSGKLVSVSSRKYISYLLHYIPISLSARFIYRLFQVNEYSDYLRQYELSPECILMPLLMLEATILGLWTPLKYAIKRYVRLIAIYSQILYLRVYLLTLTESSDIS